MSTTTRDADKSELVDRAIDLAEGSKGTGGPPHETVAELLRAYYRHVAVEDLADRTDVDVYGAFASHYKLAGNRPQGTARVRVHTPTLSDSDWAAGGHTVVEVVVDDMPFLVDSLTMELSRQLRDVHVVIHPNFDVVRDITGELQSMTAVPDGALEPEGEAERESWMHVEIDRLPEGDDPAAIVEDIQRVLRDVREAVEDWRKMHAQVEDIVSGLREDPPPLDEEEVRQAAELLEWLGRRALHLPRLQGVQARAARRRRVPRGDPGDRARHPARRPGDVVVVRPAARGRQGEGAGEDPARPGEGQLARDRAPPGVPRLRRREDVRRRTARSTASGGSSACSRARPTPSR